MSKSGASNTRTDPNAIHDNASAEISAIAEKTTPVSADLILVEDSAASNAKKRVQIGNLAGVGVGTLACVQVRMTADDLNIGTSYVDVNWDVTDIETDVGVIEHNNTNIDRIDIKADGKYLITSTMIADEVLSIQVRVNDTTVINGSYQIRVIADGNGEDGVTNVFIADLSNGDYITLQAKGGASNDDILAESSMTVIKLNGAKGDTGATGTNGTNGADGDITWEGTWVSQNYITNQAVEYLGSAYVCKLNTVSSEIPTNTTYWDLMASKGDVGPGGGVKHLAGFTANDAMYPASNPAAAESRNGHAILSFDDVTDENVIFEGFMPEYYDGLESDIITI